MDQDAPCRRRSLHAGEDRPKEFEKSLVLAIRPLGLME